MGAAATVASGPPTEVRCAEQVAVLFAARIETSAAISPVGVPEAAVGSTPFLPDDLNKQPASPQAGCF